MNAEVDAEAARRFKDAASGINVSLPIRSERLGAAAQPVASSASGRNSRL